MLGRCTIFAGTGGGVLSLGQGLPMTAGVQCNVQGVVMQCVQAHPPGAWNVRAIACACMRAHPNDPLLVSIFPTT